MSVADIQVSVIIPVYNGERFVREEVANVRAQTHTSLEILVIDDGSSDATPAILAQLGDGVRAVTQPNRGPAAARNRGLELARGNAIAFHDVDDQWAPDALERLAAHLAAHPEIDVVQGLIQRMVPAEAPEAVPSVFREAEEPYHFINLGSALFRREVFDRVGRLDEGLRENEDTDWFLRAWEQNVRKAVLPHIVLYYRLHDRNMVHGQRLVAGGVARMLKRHRDRRRQGIGNQAVADGTLPPVAAYLGLPPSADGHAAPRSLADRQWCVAAAWERRGKLESALAGYRAALRLQPGHVPARMALGRVLLAQQRTGEAVQVFREALEINSDEAEFHKGFISALVELDGLPAAFDSYGLRRRDTRPIDIAPGAILCCLTVRNEAPRLPFFLDYYRRLGVDRFLVVDNGSTDDTTALLLAEDDVYLWHSAMAFHRANYGSAWFEVLLRAHAVGHWCVIVDADELLVYPRCETHSLKALCRQMSRLGRRALTALHIDMYSDRAVRDTPYRPGQDFREVCPFFDRSPYHERHENSGPYRHQVGYFGGARRRALGGGDYCLSKVPLLKYDTDVVPGGGQHWTNLPPSKVVPDAAGLLHFKFFSSFLPYVAGEVRRGQHYDGAVQYREYARALEADPKLALYDPQQSVRYEDSRQLVAMGIVRAPEEGGEEPAAPIPAPPRLAPVPGSAPRPTWSVVITVYRRVRFLARALRSVLTQAPGPDEMEIHVIQDGADEPTAAEVRSLVTTLGAGRVTFRAAGERLGQPAIFNRCLEVARGRFVHLLHDDDWVAPGFYRALRIGLDDQARPGAAFCRHWYTDADGLPLRLSWLEGEAAGTIPDWLERIAVCCRLQTPAIVVRRDVYERLGGFHPAARSAFDWEMWVRIAAHYPVWFEPTPLAHFRTHPDGESSSLRRSGALVADARRALDLVAASLPASVRDALTRRARRRLAHYALGLAGEQRDAGDWQAAWANLSQGLACRRSAEVLDHLTRLCEPSEEGA
jgi:glycosyltransferase involved in cell wall biosynthesis